MTTPANAAVPMGEEPTPTPLTPLDIEHALVEDDPRIWSNTRKVGLLFLP